MLTFGDLPDHPPRGVVLSCLCGEFSAHRGDYFMALDSEPVGTCETCGCEIQLVKKRTVVEQWTQ